jgi:hypothetical protein
MYTAKKCSLSFCNFFFWVLGYITNCTLIGISDLWSILQLAWIDIVIFFKTHSQDLKCLSSIFKEAMATKGGLSNESKVCTKTTLHLRISGFEHIRYFPFLPCYCEICLQNHKLWKYYEIYFFSTLFLGSVFVLVRMCPDQQLKCHKLRTYDCASIVLLCKWLLFYKLWISWSPELDLSFSNTRLITYLAIYHSIWAECTFMLMHIMNIIKINKQVMKSIP